MKKRRSVDLRIQALDAMAGGMSQSEASRVFGIHRTTLGRWHKRAAVGQLEDRPSCGGPRRIKLEDEAALLLLVQASSDATLEEHVRRWQEESGQRVSSSTMRRAILRLEARGWTRKKSA